MRLTLLRDTIMGDGAPGIPLGSECAHHQAMGDAVSASPAGPPLGMVISGGAASGSAVSMWRPNSAGRGRTGREDGRALAGRKLELGLSDVGSESGGPGPSLKK